MEIYERKFKKMKHTYFVMPQAPEEVLSIRKRKRKRCIEDNGCEGQKQKRQKWQKWQKRSRRIATQHKGKDKENGNENSAPFSAQDLSAEVMQSAVKDCAESVAWKSRLLKLRNEYLNADAKSLQAYIGKQSFVQRHPKMLVQEPNPQILDFGGELQAGYNNSKPHATVHKRMTDLDQYKNLMEKFCATPVEYIEQKKANSQVSVKIYRKDFQTLVQQVQNKPDLSQAEAFKKNNDLLRRLLIPSPGKFLK